MHIFLGGGRCSPKIKTLDWMNDWIRLLQLYEESVVLYTIHFFFFFLFNVQIVYDVRNSLSVT